MFDYVSAYICITAIQQYRPHQYLSVVAIEKGAFGSPSTTVANFTVSMWKKVPFQTIQFSISTQFTCQNSSISSNSV